VNTPRIRRERPIATCLKRNGFRIPLAFWLVLVHAFIPGAAMGQNSAGEYELKAAMLYNLTYFVEWPPSAYPYSQAPTVLCILGRDPFGGTLESIASGRVVNGRLLVIRHPQNDKEANGCHVLYISSSERKSIAQILSTLKRASVLTVGEMAQFAAHGGMIQFSLEEKQVHFEINLQAASEADLKISSRLLVLARIVKDANKNPAKEGSALWSPAFEVAGAWTQRSQSELDRNASEIAISGHTEEGFRGSRQE
jgi:hypothetical protein